MSTDSRARIFRISEDAAPSSPTATPFDGWSASFTASLSRKWPLFGPMVPLKLAVWLTVTELRPFGRDFVLMSLNHVVEAGKVVAAAPLAQYFTLLVVTRKIRAEAGPAESVVPRDLQEFLGGPLILSTALLRAVVVHVADVALLAARPAVGAAAAATATASAAAAPPVIRVALVAGLVNVVVAILSAAPVVPVA